METSKRSYFTDSKGRGFPGTISNRTEQISREGSGMEPQDFTRSFTTHTGPKGRLTSTQVETPTYRSSRFIYPGGSGYETINGVEKPIQLTGGGQDFMPSFVNKIKEGYQQVEPYLPDVDIGDKSIGYDYERPMGPGIFSLGGEYDFDDNEYGLDLGYKFSFNNGGSVPERQRQRFDKDKAMNNPHHPIHANRTTYTDDQGRMFERNMRGKDRYNINVGPRPERDTTGLGGILNRFDRKYMGNMGITDIFNLLPNPYPQSLYDLLGEDRYFNQDYKNWNDKYDDEYEAWSGYKNKYDTSSERQPGLENQFNNGGIATLTEDLEQRMTTPDPQMIEPKKLTDEQKDYLYDYMLDFMFKQKQREQQENEGRIPPFNYFDMEV
jgi:hypothetical protein